MSRRGAITVIQSAAIVFGCAAVALSLARIMNSGANDQLVMASGGAIVGIIGVVVGLVVRSPVEAFERRRSSRQLFGLRIATAGLIVAVLGWLIAEFISGAIGYWVAVVGVVGGGVGIIIHNINVFKATK
ncbi:MAG: hypothetical protein AB7P08_04720 [Burkholderiales bacterium]